MEKFIAQKNGIWFKVFESNVFGGEKYRFICDDFGNVLESEMFESDIVNYNHVQKNSHRFTNQYMIKDI